MDIRKFLESGIIKVCAFALAMGLVACGDDSSSGSDDSSLTPVESEIDLAGGKKVTCDEKMDGVVAALVNGDFRRCEDGAWIKISREEALEADEILGYKGDASSSSAKVSSSSSGKVMSSSSAPAGNVGSSSSGKPAVDPEPLPEIYECPDGSFVDDEKDCPSSGSSSSINDGSEYDASTNTLKDLRDGQVYKTVEICDKNNKNCQTWMAENLNYAPKDLSDMGNEAWSGCYGDGGYDYSSKGKLTEEEVAANCSRYGRLYTWDVAMNDAACAYGMKCNAPLNPTTPVRGVCPNGWHLPSHYEFEVLIKNNDPSFEYGHKTDAFSLTAGKYLKSLTGWNTDGSDTDASGFSALPGGFRSDDGSFSDVGDYAYIWSSGEFDKNYVFNLNLHDINEYADLDRSVKNFAKSVRCLKDTNPAVTPDP